MKEALAGILKRVGNWPEAAQDEAAASLRWIERELIEPYRLSDDDKRAVDRGLTDLRAGRLVPDDEIAEFFRRHRR
jgi:hypothetical protein